MPMSAAAALSVCLPAFAALSADNKILLTLLALPAAAYFAMFTFQRGLPYLKSFILAAVWGIATTAPDFTEYESVLLTVHRVALFWSNTLWFEFRDSDLKIESLAKTLIGLLVIDFSLSSLLARPSGSLLIYSEVLPVFIYTVWVLRYLRTGFKPSETFYIRADYVLLLPPLLIFLFDFQL